MKRTEKTRREPSTSTLQRESDAPSWLQEQVYGPKRQRTIDLVKCSVDTLLKEQQRISLASVATVSKRVDPTAQGISESAILGNEDARAYYERHRTWRGKLRRPSSATMRTHKTNLSSLKAGRDAEQVRYRYLRLCKEELVDRLLATEQVCIEQEQRWLGQQDELLTWQLRAETAEARLKS